MLRVGITKTELIDARLRGREYMAAICVELIQRLQLKIQELRQVASKPTGTLLLHPLIHDATAELVNNGHIWEAVFAASKTLVLHVKELSGRHDLDGVPLMRTVFSKNNPVLRFNSGSPATDQDEQEGMMHLFEGAVMAIRNPGGHAFPSGPERQALEYLQLISMLTYRANDAYKP